MLRINTKLSIIPSHSTRALLNIIIQTSSKSSGFMGASPISRFRAYSLSPGGKFDVASLGSSGEGFADTRVDLKSKL